MRAMIRTPKDSWNAAASRSATRYSARATAVILLFTSWAIVHAQAVEAQVPYLARTSG